MLSLFDGEFVVASSLIFCVLIPVVSAICLPPHAGMNRTIDILLSGVLPDPLPELPDSHFQTHTELFNISFSDRKSFLLIHDTLSFLWDCRYV
jgi:hypothetical protein